MSHITHQDLTDLSRIDARIFQSELIVTAQQARVDSLERTGNDSSLSRSVLRSFQTCLHLQYAHRKRVLHQLRH
jgi:adenylosuccinate lyase